MKVILTENVEELGVMGDLINVSEGYGRNFLLPRGLAILASKANIKTVEHEKRIIAKRKEKIAGQVNEIKGRIEKTEITVSARVGENDRIFGSVTKADIWDKLKEAGFDIDRKAILLDNPIKDLGVQTVKIKLHPEIIAIARVNVVPERPSSE